MVELSALNAAARGFALVCFGDGRLVEAEEARFRSFAKHDRALEGADPDALSDAWSDAIREIAASKDGESAITALAVETIRAEDKALAMRAAQAAVVADDAVKPQEEAWLARIAQGLGLEPSGF